MHLLKNLSLAAILLVGSMSVYAQAPTLGQLTCEHKINPIGLDQPHPRLSWVINATENDVLQTAYSLRVLSGNTFSKAKTVWESGKIASDASILQPYEGPALQPGTRYWWQVRIWDNHGHVSKWSAPAFWETGLMTPDAWHAQWIEMPNDTARFAPAPYFRKDFSVPKKVAYARAYVTAHGLYELSINGQKVGDQVLTPGWTSYGKRLQYQVYDITPLVKQGDNAVGAVLGNGWFRGTLAWGDNWAVYGKSLGLLAQLELTYTDGTVQRVVTDGSWTCCQDGPIRMDDLYDGQTIDATKAMTGWNLAHYNDAGWKQAVTASYPYLLVDSQSDAVRKVEEIKPLAIFRTPQGSLVADMGQNMVGWMRLTVAGPKGSHITLRHAEVLDKEGNFYTDNLRQAKCELHFTLAGTGTEVLEPQFTFMGFRYVEIIGFPGTLTADNLTGVVVHSDMTPTGTFHSSDSLLNQLQHNIVWGQKGNFVDVPTDCPQRDERLGWTGDAQAFCRTAAFNYNVAPFFTKWLKDVALDQRAGAVPNVVPDVLNSQTATTITPSAGWGDVAVIAPWTMYMVYGDKDLLAQQYPSMKAWVAYIRKAAGEDLIWNGGSTFGDWLFYHPFDTDHTTPDGHTDRDFIATAFYAYSANLLSQAAQALGKDSEAQEYTALFNAIKKVFIQQYVTPSGRVGTQSQTSFVLALMFDLLPEDLRPAAARFLAEDIKSRGNHLSTGFLGTPYLCHVLSDNGYADVAYDLLMQQTFPSWLYPVTMGATTIWERWDGQRPDGTFQDAGMNSFNHYAYGAIGDWCYRVSAGLDTQEAGYRHLWLRPTPTDQLDYAHATLQTPYGLAACGWERQDGKVTVKVTVPANATATVVLPSGKRQIGSGTYQFTYDN